VYARVRSHFTFKLVGTDFFWLRFCKEAGKSVLSKWTALLFPAPRLVLAFFRKFVAWMELVGTGDDGVVTFRPPVPSMKNILISRPGAKEGRSVLRSVWRPL
jgi:hypothetical protein